MIFDKINKYKLLAIITLFVTSNLYSQSNELQTLEIETLKSMLGNEVYHDPNLLSILLLKSEEQPSRAPSFEFKLEREQKVGVFYKTSLDSSTYKVLFAKNLKEGYYRLFLRDEFLRRYCDLCFNSKESVLIPFYLIIGEDVRQVYKSVSFLND